MPDGSINPSTANITTADHIIYTFTANNYAPIVVQRNNIILDGRGYTLQSPGGYSNNGVFLDGRTNVTITNIRITAFAFGVSAYSSYGSRITNNRITGINLGYGYYLGYGINLVSSSNNTLFQNIITNNQYGLFFDSSSRNTLRVNTITNGQYGVYFDSSSDNALLRNTITDNPNGIYFASSSRNNLLSINTISNNGGGVTLNPSCDNSTLSWNFIEANDLHGVWLGSSDNTLSNNEVTNTKYSDGIYVTSSGNTLSGNTISENNGDGIWLQSSSSTNTLSGNTITNNQFGITIDSSNNTISGNTISANSHDGVRLTSLAMNRIFHNNFIGNVQQVGIQESANIWDDGYPSGGNYWSNYNDTDLFSGPYQNINGSDGLGDKPYIIDTNNTDSYPLAAPFKAFDAGNWNGTQHFVNIVSNSTLAGFNFDLATNPPTLGFDVTGTNATVGFCRVAIPKAFMWCDSDDQWTVVVNGTLLQRGIVTDANYTYIYFAYHHSTQTVEINSTHAVFFSTVNPTSLTMDLGQSAIFTTIIFGGTPPYTYQWYLNGGQVSGANSIDWTFSPTSIGINQIHAEVIDNVGNNSTTSTATVTVNSAPSANLSPTSSTLDIGQSQQFTSTASGGTSPYFYQWYLNDTAVSDATNPTWDFLPSVAGSYAVYVKVTDNVGAQAKSDTANVTVHLAPIVTIVSVSAAMDIGQQRSLTSTVTHGTPPYTYQWFLNGVAVSGAVNSTWIFQPSSAGTYNIYVNVTDNVNIKAKSSIVTMTVNTIPSVTISPGSVVMDVGQSHTFSSTISGGTLPCSYQWYLNGTAVSGATNSSWTFTPSSSAFYTVYVNVTDAAGTIATSNTSQVRANPGAPITIIIAISVAIILAIIVAVYAVIIRRRKKR